MNVKKIIAKNELAIWLVASLCVMVLFISDIHRPDSKISTLLYFWALSFMLRVWFAGASVLPKTFKWRALREAAFFLVPVAISILFSVAKKDAAYEAPSEVIRAGILYAVFALVPFYLIRFGMWVQAKMARKP